MGGGREATHLVPGAEATHPHSYITFQKCEHFTPRLPYMYFLIKTHKLDNPARPIISSIDSCSYELFKCLAQQLRPYIGTISNSHIINSLDLVSKLSTLNVNYNYKLVSFDVKSLFTK